MTTQKITRKPLPSQEALMAILRYDAATGKLFWLEWKNGRRSDLRAGAQKTGKRVKYLKIGIDRDQYYTHRVIWKLMTGEEPQEIDHINGNRLDNSWENLRAVTASENRRNSSRPSNNKSGHIGVYYCNRYETWRAMISVNGKQKHVGQSKDKNVAIALREKAERRFGYHENHGRESW